MLFLIHGANDTYSKSRSLMTNFPWLFYLPMYSGTTKTRAQFPLEVPCLARYGLGNFFKARCMFQITCASTYCTKYMMLTDFPVMRSESTSSEFLIAGR